MKQRKVMLKIGEYQFIGWMVLPPAARGVYKTKHSVSSLYEYSPGWYALHVVDNDNPASVNFATQLGSDDAVYWLESHGFKIREDEKRYCVPSRN